MKKLIMFLSVILISASCAFYFALNDRINLPNRYIYFNNPEDTVKHLFNNWNYNIKISKNHSLNSLTSDKPSDELLMAFSKRLQGVLLLEHESTRLYHIDEFSLNVESFSIKDKSETTGMFHKEELNNMGIGMDENDIKTIDVEYIGEPFPNPNSNVKGEKTRLTSTFFLIKEDNSWVIDGIRRNHSNYPDS